MRYTFTVTNTGNVALFSVVVSDPKVLVVGGPIPVLPVGASDSTTFMGSYTLTQADIDAGSVYNVALATGNSYHTSLTRKSPKEMVDEVVDNILKQRK